MVSSDSCEERLEVYSGRSRGRSDYIVGLPSLTSHDETTGRGKLERPLSCSVCLFVVRLSLSLSSFCLQRLLILGNPLRVADLENYCFNLFVLIK